MRLLRYFTLFFLIILFSSSSEKLGIQPKVITELFFPDPDIDIPTPGFLKKKGYTNFMELRAFLKQKVYKYPNQMSLVNIGKSQDGKDILAVKIHGESPVESPIRVWLQAGLHGNEMGSVEGMLYLIHNLLNSPKLLNGFEMMIIPLANPDGYSKQNRYSKNGMDLNRDHTMISAPETLCLKRAFSLFDPEMALDFHEYRPFRRDFVNLGKFGVTSMFDVMFLYTSNPNVPAALRKLIHDSFVRPCHADLDSLGYTHHTYFSTEKHLGSLRLREGSSSARSSSTSYALSNCVSALIEIRGVGIGKTSFKRRVACVSEVGLSFLRSAIESKKEMRKVLNDSSEQQEIIYATDYLIEKRDMNFIDLHEKSIRSFELEVRDLSQPRNSLRRERPEAYLVSEELFREISPKLEALGIAHELIEFNSLDKNRVYEYIITKYLQNGTPEFRVRRQNVKSKLEPFENENLKKVWYISTSQKHGSHLFELFEPEAKNSYVAWDIIHTELNQKLKYYRYHAI